MDYLLFIIIIIIMDSNVKDIYKNNFVGPKIVIA
jgi:hypothetical protein